MFLTDVEREETIRACRFCPMCYQADTVAQVVRKETHTPRGRGLTLFAVQAGLLGWTPDVVASMYRHATDGLDQEWCVGNYDHDELILWARAEIVRAGKAPDAVQRALASLRAVGNPWGAPEPPVAEAPPGERVAFLGPAARVHRPELGRALLQIGRAAGTPLGRLPAEGCCGMTAYLLGDLELAAAQARALCAAVTARGVRELVVLDADAFRFLQLRARRLGAAWPPGLAIVHATQWLAGLVDAGRLRLRAPADLRGARVAFQDPCSLARFTRVLDEPRRVLAAIEGVTAVEFPWAREKARCCGGGGTLWLTDPDVTAAVAGRRLGELEPKSVDVIVSACPTCEASLAPAARDQGLRVMDLVELVAASAA
jgi:Fe-S oxidoreductase